LSLAVKAKYNSCLGNYDGFNAADVTYEFLKKMPILIADVDKVLEDRIFRNMRDQIAVALNSSHGELIHWPNRRNGSLIR
jgi:hypothetical protein